MTIGIIYGIFIVYGTTPFISRLSKLKIPNLPAKVVTNVTIG